ncbi:MAG: glycosyltransferase [Candidatus Krumholzibacteria bacterium]|nr:glycosyltransferase [Candidatus Krumholzibacteria bacterium]
MRIGFLGDGSLNHVRRWAGYFHDRGHEVLLISFEDIGGCKFPARRIEKRLPTKILGYLSALGSVQRVLDSFKPELVNALYVGGYGLIGALGGFRPLVVSALGSDLLVDYRSHLFHKIQIRHAIRRADLVTTDADNLSEIAASIGAPPEKILKIYFGIDEDLFHPQTDRQTISERKSGRFNIVSTRNLYPIYNIDLLIEAAPAVLDRIDATFVICGAGPERKRLEAKASRLGVAERFVFKGKLEPADIADQLRCAAVYLSTSLSDSTSVSLLEAMACGAPPVVTDLPANREWIENRVNGLLVPPGDPAALAGAVIEMAENTDLSRKAREKNLRIIKERGLWNLNMERLENAFLELAASRKK